MQDAESWWPAGSEALGELDLRATPLVLASMPCRMARGRLRSSALSQVRAVRP